MVNLYVICVAKDNAQENSKWAIEYPQNNLVDS